MKDCIVIEKKAGDVIVWRVDSEDIAYNTELVVGNGLTVILESEGYEYITGAGRKTVGSVMSGKSTKLIGGKKPLACKLYAFDESGEFSAFWGVNIPNIIDKKTNVIHSVQANGSYRFKINNIRSFVEKMKVSAAESLNEAEIKVQIRAGLHQIISDCLATALGSQSMFEIQSNKIAVCDAIKAAAKAQVGKSGIALTEIVIKEIVFSPEDAEAIGRIHDAQLDTTVKKIENEALRDELQIKAEYEKAVGAVRKNNLERVRTCPVCNEDNDISAIYCKKCGKKIIQ